MTTTQPVEATEHNLATVGAARGRALVSLYQGEAEHSLDNIQDAITDLVHYSREVEQDLPAILDQGDTALAALRQVDHELQDGTSTGAPFALPAQTLAAVALVGDPVHAAAEEAGLGVMGHVLDVVRDAGEVGADFLATLTADDIEALYAQHIARAILRMEDALKVREAETAPARAALAALEVAATEHGVRLGENTTTTDFPSWLVEREGDGVLGAVGYDRGDFVAETDDDTTTHTTAAAAVAAVAAAA